MPTKTKIEWTNYSSNPIRFRSDNGVIVPWACVKFSPGCANCYAEGQSWRFLHRDYTVENMRDLTPFLDEKELHSLLHMKSLAGKRVFIGDMTDIFGEWVTDDMLDRLFAVFALRPDVTFQVLTKRAQRMRAYIENAVPCDDITVAACELIGRDFEFFSSERVELPLRNVWLGFSGENQPTFDERWLQVTHLASAGWITFCSAEPLLSAIDMTTVESQTPGNVFNALRDDGGALSWVIAGGESGPGARPCDVAWIRSIVQQCQAAGVPAFVKQLGSDPRWANADVAPIQPARRKCNDPSEWPESLRVREFPQEARS